MLQNLVDRTLEPRSPLNRRAEKRLFNTDTAKKKETKPVKILVVVVVRELNSACE